MKKGMILAAVLVAALGTVVTVKKMSHNSVIESVQEAVVDITKPEIKDIMLKTELIGTIEPEEVVSIYPRITGEVSQVNIKTGDIVKAGQQLCVIDSKAVDTSRNQMESAALALRQAEEKLTRQSILYNGGGLSEEEYRQYQDAVVSAKLSYKEAKSQYEDQMSQSHITAPIDGVIETSNISLHNSVASDKPIFVIAGKGDRVVSFSVTERILKCLKVGDTVSIEKDGAYYDGIIYEINTRADSATGLFLVKARLKESYSEAVFTTGSMEKLQVISERALQVLTVPADAIYYDMDKAYVYTYSDSKVYKTLVETGLSDEVITEIRDGLSGDSQVLKTWSSELYEGASVRARLQEGEQTEWE